MESGQQTQQAPGESSMGSERGLHTMWGAVAPGWERERGLRRPPREAADGQRCSRPPRCSRATGCSSSPAGRADSGSLPRSGSARKARSSSRTSHPQMTAIAAERAEARGLANTTTRVLDLEDDRRARRVATTPCSVARASCWCPSPTGRGARSAASCAPADGPSISVWGAREHNPWLGAMLDALGAQLGGTFPPPGMPGPLSLGGPDQFQQALAGGGFEDVEIAEVEVPWRGESFDEWWLRTTALAGPVAKLLAGAASGCGRGNSLACPQRR